MPTGTKGDYEVGYGKPPRGAGFKKSQSGNTRGCGLLPLRPLTQLKANGPFLYRRDHTPRCVASLDQISGGRFLFGIGGGGWNQEEIENHDTVFATRMRKMREQIEAMRAIWTDTKPKYHGELRFRHDYDPAEAGAEAASTRYPRRRLSVGGAAGDPLWQRLVSERCERQSRGIPAGLPQDGAGRWARDPASLPVTIGGAPDDLDKLRRFRDLGAARANVSLMSEASDDILPILDTWAGYIRQLRG